MTSQACRGAAKTCQVRAAARHGANGFRSRPHRTRQDRTRPSPGWPAPAPRRPGRPPRVTGSTRRTVRPVRRAPGPSPSAPPPGHGPVARVVRRCPCRPCPGSSAGVRVRPCAGSSVRVRVGPCAGSSGPSGAGRPLQFQQHRVVGAARRVLHADLAHAVRRQVRVEGPGRDLRGLPRAVAASVNSRCSSPRSPAKAQQPALSGTTTSSARRPAPARSAGPPPRAAGPRRWCTTADRTRRRTVSSGSSRSAAHTVASSTVSSPCSCRLRSLRYGAASRP